MSASELIQTILAEARALPEQDRREFLAEIGGAIDAAIGEHDDEMASKGGD